MSVLAPRDPATPDRPAPFRRWGQALLDLFVPPRCLACGAVVHATEGVCPRCWPGLAFITDPVCAACGLPLEFELGTGALCGACLKDRPVFDSARAVLLYNELGRDLLMRFKYGDRTDAAPVFGRWMARAGAELLARADVIVPVPLHRARLLGRRYNQAALLARVIGRESGVPVWPDLLHRTRRTQSLGGLGRAARERTVRGAFALNPDYRARPIDGLRVLLVDDVLTSGATANSCAATLGAAGAGEVNVLTLSRVAPD